MTSLIYVLALPLVCSMKYPIVLNCGYGSLVSMPDVIQPEMAVWKFHVVQRHLYVTANVDYIATYHAR